MKIGVFLPDENPVLGGTSTMLSAILSEIEESNYLCDICVIYRGGLFDKLKSKKNNIEYININRFKLTIFLKYWIIQMTYHFKDFKERLWMRVPTKSMASYFDMLAKKEGISLFWFTMPVCEILSTPYIFTVWDLGHRTLPMFPEMTNSTFEWDSREKMYQRMLPRASYIITGNNSGKNEIVENYNIPADRIHTIEFMVPSLFRGDAIKPTVNLPELFFYYPAQFWAHKNHTLILEALKKLKDDYAITANVVFTGHDYGTKGYIENKARKLEVDKQVYILGFLELGEVKYLYQNARALVYPSLLGPNNLPPLEAIALGCPVLISDLVGHKEQLGDAAIFFDRYSADDLAQAMKNILDDSNRLMLLDKAKDYIEKKKNYSYTNEVIKIIQDFETNMKRWKEV
ncbi:glycosyltransferase family 4 protein [Butyrivibrio sp. XBB1001]|uniref:glycosyltransferase family 4 protein n=1 Tax=Butyrivibrio sp. XBB1001 TaxID=1280682 RepID=UPI0004265AFB|nr:glycosyltransferase family 1 protein [Butyrivibrio sp. XBB1001]